MAGQQASRRIGAGQGLDTLTRDIATQLTSDDFWSFVERLATGRRLVITSDHGYAATGLFFDAADEQASFLKSILKSGRVVPGEHDPGPFVPLSPCRRPARTGTICSRSAGGNGEARAVTQPWHMAGSPFWRCCRRS